jgi:hypothetical protein
MLIRFRNSARPRMPSIIDKLSNIDRYRQTITIIVSSLIVLSITSLSSAASSTPCEDSGDKQEACTSAPSLPGLQQQPEVCAHAADTPETTSAVLRTTSQSAANMDDMSTERLPWRGGCCHLGRGSAIFRNHLAPILGEVRNGKSKPF